MAAAAAMGLPALLILQPAPGQAAPATEAEMALYTRIAAFNTCIGKAAGLEFEKAAAIAGETIAQLLQSQHQGAIQQVGPTPLGMKELRQGAVNSAVLGAAEICPKEMPAEVLRKAEAVLRQAEPRSAPAGVNPSQARPAAAPTPAPKPAPKPKGPASRP